jgi:glycosyltransferase involved in cell wall biosynthesis
MRICHVIPSLDPADGGPPVVVERLGAAQASLGADVAIAYGERPGADDRIRRSLEEAPGADRLDLRPLHRPRAGDVAAALDHDLNFVHIHGVWTPLLATAAAQCGRRGVPYCVAPHGMLDPWSLKQKRLKKAAALAILWKRLLNRAAFIHALNRDEADLVAPLGLIAPTEVIPNGIFIEEFERLPALGTFRAARPELADDPYVLFLGRLHHKKGLDLLAPAFARTLERLPSARLVVAGPDDGAREPFVRQVRSLNIESRVHLVGPLYSADKLAALRDAACFCLPSRQEGFSIAVTEALACAVPCVISADCHFPEVDEAGAGRVTTLEPANIAEALVEVLSNPESARAMGEAGARLVLERFTWPRIANQTLAVYARRRPPG